MSKENSLFKEATIKRLISNVNITAKHKKSINKWLDYFNRANEIFSHIIYWLNKNNLLNIERYKLVLQFSEEESKIIEESLK
ncbi:MAG: hypothetical protein Q8P60_03605 [Pseudorhodobacter sp.]|nr:hypothetical protein [Pseudorhodobacter sp.]